MRFVATILILASVAAATAASAAEFSHVVHDKSSIVFVSKQMGVPVDGKVRKFTAQIAFDPSKPETGKAQIEIDSTSIDTCSQDADDEVVSKNWFNVKAFPTVKFVSSGVTALGGGRYEVAGKMTIKGKTRDVVAPFAFKQEGNNGQFEGAFSLKRLEYGIGEGPWSDTGTVADEVQVKFRFVVAAAKG